MNVMREFRAYSGSSCDIGEHLGLLRGLAMRPNVHTIVEIGFRKGISTIALCSSGKPVTSYDVADCRPHSVSLKRAAENFTFVRGDSLKIDIPACDLLHIDSLHTHDHLLAELRRHSPQCSTFIALHDTETFGKIGKDGSKPGLQAAIETFLNESEGKWKLHLHLPNNNGMTLLVRGPT